MLRIFRKLATRTAALLALQYTVVSLMTAIATAIAAQKTGEMIASKFEAIAIAFRRLPF